MQSVSSALSTSGMDLECPDFNMVIARNFNYVHHYYPQHTIVTYDIYYKTIDPILWDC